MPRTFWVRTGVAICLLMFTAAFAAAQRGTAAKPELTPAKPEQTPAKPEQTRSSSRLSMTCPMHPDVIESKPGSCPICKMSLVAVRLDTSWICPFHTNVMSHQAGSCPICRRPLVEARVAVTYTCKSQPGLDRIEPGTCPDGTPMTERRTLRPHGNHNPQHGGQFFMAADNWHHVEGTYPRAGVFRLYVYDDYARPLAAERLKLVAARVVTNERYDAKTRTSTDVTAFQLRPSRDSAYLEARVTGVTFPAAMTAKIKLKPEAPEYRFDFTFAAVTKDPVAALPATQTSKPRTPSPKAVPATTAVSDPSTASTTIPETIPEILTQLKARDAEIRELIKQGNFAAVWVPAFQAKDLAVALEPHIGRLPPAAREAVEPALQRVVRFAWLLDSFGDLGNRQQVEDAYAAFSKAAGEVASLFGSAP